MNIFAYRADTGFTHPKGRTALDVVNYEMKELRNEIGFNKVNIELCRNTPAAYCQWVTFNEDDAERYGDVETILLNNPLIIGEDGKGGYLVIDRYYGDGTYPIFLREKVTPCRAQIGGLYIYEALDGEPPPIVYVYRNINGLKKGTRLHVRVILEDSLEVWAVDDEGNEHKIGTEHLTLKEQPHE